MNIEAKFDGAIPTDFSWKCYVDGSGFRDIVDGNERHISAGDFRPSRVVEGVV